MHLTDRRVVVTGGAGLIGSHLAAGLVDDNDVIVVFCLRLACCLRLGGRLGFELANPVFCLDELLGEPVDRGAKLCHLRFKFVDAFTHTMTTSLYPDKTVSDTCVRAE